MNPIGHIENMNPLEPGFWAKYGPGFVIAFIFACAIVALFWMLYSSQRERIRTLEKLLEDERNGRLRDKESFANERASFAIERKGWEVSAGEGEIEVSRIREACERDKREMAQQHAKDLRELRLEQQSREDAARRETAEMFERIVARIEAAMDKITAVLQKFYDRFVGPRSRQR